MTEQEIFSTPPPNDLVAVATVAPTAIDVEPFAKAAAHLQMFDKLRDVALKLCRPTDFHLFGNRPWPMRSACEKIMRALGLNVRMFRHTDGSPYIKKYSQDEHGGYYVVTVSGTISGAWGELEVMGFCSSRDQFFAREGTDKDGNPLYKPLSEINESDIAMSAYTNFLANAVTRYTGMGGLTEEDLNKVYGEGAVSKHTYAESKAKKTTTDVAARSSQMKELAAICMVMGDGIESEAANLCEQMSAFTGKDGKTIPGKRSPKDLSDGRLNATLGTAKKWWKEFLEKSGDQAGFYEGLLKTRLEGGKDGADQG